MAERSRHARVESEGSARAVESRFHVPLGRTVAESVDVRRHVGDSPGAVTGYRCAELAAVSPDGRIEFRIQRELRNDNANNRHPHWSKKNQKRKLWQVALTNALVTALGFDQARRMLVPESGLAFACGERCQVRRRLEITRLVPSKRNFVRDTFENLPWTAKELRDAIKNLGLIRDDSARWTETVITQELSTDGTPWTWIVIDAPTSEASS